MVSYVMRNVFYFGVVGLLVIVNYVFMLIVVL